MGYLLHIALAIGALALVELSPFETWNAPWVVVALAGVPHLCAALSRRQFLNGRFTTGLLLARAAQASPPVSFLAALTIGGWRDVVGRWIGHAFSPLEWPELGLFLILAPFVVYEALAIDAHARSVSASPRDARATRNLQLRMFASALLPLSVYIVATACIGLSEELRINVEEVSLYHALFAGVLLLALASALPTILRLTWDTSPIPHGEQRALLDEVATRARFQSRDILVWNTGHSMANAAIVGVGRRRRIVFFSDALLAQLGPRELAAVFAHEIGHALHHHIPIFGAWALGFFLAMDLAIRAFIGDGGWESGAAMACAVVAWYFLFGYLSRRFELDADLFGMELLGDPAGLTQALERVGGRLRDVASWRHFSTARRVDFIQRATSDPEVGRRLRKVIRRVTWLGILLFAAAVSLEIRDVARDLGADRVRVDLRLGRYEAAQARARSSELDATLASLVLRSKSLNGSDGSIEEIEKRARTALENRDVDSAMQWLELGSMRGSRELASVASAVTSIAAGDPKENDALLDGELLHAWRKELAAIERERRAETP